MFMVFRMKIGKVLILCICLAFLLSMGGVFAEENNITDVQSSVDCDVCDVVADSQAVLVDTLYADEKVTSDLNASGNNDKLTVHLVDESCEDDNSIVWDKISLSDDSVDVLNVSENLTIDVVGLDVVSYEGCPIVNPDFEDSTKPVGWSYSDISIYTYAKYAKNGKRFLSLAQGGYISQNVNLDTVNTISFWYMSETKGSAFELLIDDKSIMKYVIKNSGMGKWEEISFDVSNYSGFHTIKIKQTNNAAYIDYFNLNYNNRIVANLSLSSFTLNGDDLTLSFSDESFGLIDGWFWDFGDGSNSTQQNPTHTFNIGHYTVKLKVYNKYSTEYKIYEVPITFPTVMSSGKEFTSVQRAIDAAVDGDVINVYNNIFYSRYFENFVIDKSLTINFFNCTLETDGVNPVITVVNGSDVVVNNVIFDNGVFLKTDDWSSLSIGGSVLTNVTLIEGNFKLNNNQLTNAHINVDAHLEMINSTVVNCEVVLNSGDVSIVGSAFLDCDVAFVQNGGVSIIRDSLFNNSDKGIMINGGVADIYCNVLSFNNVGVLQIGGNSSIKSNAIFNNSRGVEVINSSLSVVSFNAIFCNEIGLLYYSDVIKSDNWWGSNYPNYVYSDMPISSDICQIGGNKSDITDWLILNITQSNNIDYQYWIAGITYYNLTLDLNYNNHGEYLGDKFSLNNFSLNLTSIGDIKERIHHFYVVNGKLTRDIEYTYNIASVSGEIIDNYGNFIFTYGYLTNNLKEITFTLFNQNYTVSVLNDTISPVISYITPSALFNDSLTIEIICNDSDAVVFYTLDGSNPAYSPTRFIYTNPIIINETCTLHYAVIDKTGNFQKYFTDSTNNRINLDIIRQDVYIELSSGYPIYYTLDGSNPEQYNGFNTIDPTNSYFGYNRETTGSNLLYTHPFIVHDIMEIRFAAQDRNDSYWVFNSNVNIICSNFDNSVNYIRNSSEYSSDAVWSQYQGDNRNNGVSDLIGPVTNHSSWDNPTFTSGGSAVVDSKGHIYIGADDGYLYCLNNQGLVIWRYGTTSKIICTPTIGPDGNIYFSNWKNSSAYCISPNGTLIWKLNLGDYNTGTSPVFGLNNRLYIITSNNFSSTMYVIRDGVVESSHVIPSISGSTPAVTSDGTLYMSSLYHQLVVVNWDGSLRTTRMFGTYYDIKNTQCSVSVGPDDIIYLVRGQQYTSDIYHDSHNSLTAFYPNATVKWSTDGGYYPLSGAPSYCDGVLYVVGNSKLIAFDAETGRLMWARDIRASGNTLSSPLISDEGVLYVSSANVVYAFYKDGTFIWQYEIPVGEYGEPISYSSPVLTNTHTLVVTTSQGIFAFNDIAADFKYSHVEGTASTIQFTDLSTYGDNRYYWMFGDGNVSREQNPVHTYADGGRYRVVLLVEHNGEMLARNTTITVIYKDTVPPSNVSAYVNDTLCDGGVFNETQWVSFNATDDYGSVVIYYTVDGSNPLNSSTRRVYINPFDVEVNTVLSMVAVDSSGNVGNVSSIFLNITDVIVVNSTLVDEIQKLLDEAEPYSKFLFDYDLIEGANFTINKPLNIISNNNTCLVGNDNQPVFTFTENASGAIINGFVVENDGILIRNTSDITIRNTVVNTSNKTGINIVLSCNITVKDSFVNGSCDGILINRSCNTTLNHVEVNESYNNGVWIIDSNGTDIFNSTMNNNGKDWYSTKAHHIWLVRSRGTNLINNTLNYGFFGVHLSDDNWDLKMDYNTIYEGTGDAIILDGAYHNINITHNTLDGCFNGINFNGYCDGVNVEHNLIQKMHEHDGEPFFISDYHYVYDFWNWDDLYGQYNNALEVSCGASNFHDGVRIIDNVCILLNHRAWESRHTSTYVDASCDGYGYNLMDGSSSYTGTGGATRYREGKVDLVVDRIGDSTFRLRLINRLDGHFLSEIPEFDVTFLAGGFYQNVKFVNDSAIARFDVAAVVSEITAIISTEIRKSVAFDIEIAEGFEGSTLRDDPGFERGEAWDNPDPVIPRIPPEKEDHPYVPDYPNVPDYPSEPVVDTGEGSGNGSGNGNGNGNGLFDGNGNGSAFGQGDGTHGSSNTDVKGREGLNVDDMNELAESFVGDLDPVGVNSAAQGSDVSIEGESSGGEGETAKAYEVTKQINAEKINQFGFVFVIIFVLIVTIVGYVKKKYFEGGQL